MSNSRPALRLLLCALALACAFTAAGCGGKKDGALQGQTAAGSVIQIKGSDTMVNVAQAWAEAYRKVAPEVAIEVSGGGSGVGIAALIKGAVDIANASRDIKASEEESVLKNTGKEPWGFIAGYDALAVYVHRDNPIERIALPELARIYAEDGDITLWSQLGITLPSGHDKIIRVSRQSSSGTYEFLRSLVLKNKDFKLGSCDLNGSKEVVELVSNTPGAIGYSGMGYATDRVKMLEVAVVKEGPYYAPTVANTIAKVYPVARALHLYTLGEPTGAVKAYIDWIESTQGQEIVTDSGYVPAHPPEEGR